MRSKSSAILLLVAFLLSSCAPVDIANDGASTPDIVTSSLTSTSLPVETSMNTPVPTPVCEEIQYYALNFEFVCSSEFCSVEFLNPEVIQTVTNVDYNENVRVSFEYPFINIDRHGEYLAPENIEILSFVLVLAVEDKDKTLQIQSRHGYSGGSTLRFFLNEENALIEFEKIDHNFRNPNNPNENPEVFSISLEALGNFSPSSKRMEISPAGKLAWAVYYAAYGNTTGSGGWFWPDMIVDRPLNLYDSNN